MTLYVTRHGETEWNAKHIISGLAEIPLSEKGRLQAASLAARLAERQNDYRIKHILVSPLGRARETASYIEKALGIDAVVEERLHEIDFGAFEHTSTQGAEFLAIKANPYKRFPGGESLLYAAYRVYGAIEDARTRFAPDNILFVCHGMLSVLISTYFQDYETIEEFTNSGFENCGLQAYEFK